MQSLAPQRKPRNFYADRMVHAAVRSLFLFLKLLPASVARWLGRAAGRVGWRLLKKARRQVLRNMDIVFRDRKTAAQKDELGRRYFEHTGLYAVEFARMGRLTRDNVNELIDLTELPQMDRLLSAKKGLMCVPAHHGNLELCGYIVGLMGYSAKSVARPLDNPLLNDLILEMRQRSGQVIVDKWKVLWKLKKMLDRGDIVSMSVDQNGGDSGLFIPFFGSLASTVSSPADLHVITGTPIIVCTLNRKADGIHHVFRVWDVIEKDPEKTMDARAVLTRINRAVERAILEYPEQWLWLHKRWKTRPPGEQPTADGLPPLIE